MASRFPVSSNLTSNYTTSVLRRSLALRNQLTPIHTYIQKMKAHPITTAAALIIGDEVLNGKIKDTNSNYFAQFCFNNNIDLRNITVVADDEAEIVETLQRLTKKYDFIITTGGIGPTHDDITYEAIGKAFDVPVAIDPILKQKMAKYGSGKPKSEEAYAAQLRMATIPVSDMSKGVTVDTIYVDETLWVPIVAINHKVHIFPGIPQLFKRMLNGLLPYVKERLSKHEYVRFYVKTHMRESELAPYLTKKQLEVNGKGIKLGSYPHFSAGINTVSIIGKEKDSEYIKDLVEDVVKNIKGTQITKEEEDSYSH